MHVLIAGGGLSGLALAQGLIKDGHTCQVFGRTPLTPELAAQLPRTCTKA